MKYSYFTLQSLVCSGGEKIADHTMTDICQSYEDPEPVETLSHGHKLYRDVSWLGFFDG